MQRLQFAFPAAPPAAGCRIVEYGHAPREAPAQVAAQSAPTQSPPYFPATTPLPPPVAPRRRQRLQGVAVAADRLTRQRRARSTAAEADAATRGRRRRRCAVAGRERERGRWRWQGQRMLMAFAPANTRSGARTHSLRREPEGCAWGWSTAGREESRARSHPPPPFSPGARGARAAPRRLRLARPGGRCPPPPPPHFFFPTSACRAERRY